MFDFEFVLQSNKIYTNIMRKKVVIKCVSSYNNVFFLMKKIVVVGVAGARQESGEEAPHQGSVRERRRCN